jgi:hypothetical protein
MTEPVRELLDVKGLRLVLFLEVFDFGPVLVLVPDRVEGDPGSPQDRTRQEHGRSHQEADMGQADLDLLLAPCLRGREG